MATTGNGICSHDDDDDGRRRSTRVFCHQPLKNPVSSTTHPTLVFLPLFLSLISSYLKYFTRKPEERKEKPSRALEQSALYSVMSVPGGAAALRQSLRKSTRIIAIPLSRPLPPRASASTTKSSPTGSLPQPNGSQSGPRALTYYHFQLSSKKKRKDKAEEQGQKSKEGVAPGGEGDKPQSRWSLPEGGVSAWVQNKAAETWAGFGRAEGGWKVRLFPFLYLYLSFTFPLSLYFHSLCSFRS